MLVEFKLAMPGRGSWDNRWSGESRNFSIVKELDDARALYLNGQSWWYSWPDGWRAEVSARIVRDVATLPPSHGFHGYDWMIESILAHGKIYANHEQPGQAS